METQLVFVFVVLLVAIAIVWSRSESGLTAKVDSERDAHRRERESWAHEKIMSSEQVLAERDKLINTLEESLAEHPNQLGQLKQIVQDWANLKIKSFQERRSWVRSADRAESD